VIYDVPRTHQVCYYYTVFAVCYNEAYTIVHVHLSLA